MKYVCIKCGKGYECNHTPIINKSDGCCTSGSLIEYDEFITHSTSLIQNGTVKLYVAMKIVQNSYYESVGNILNTINNDTI